jgi:hypothetical protein
VPQPADVAAIRDELLELYTQTWREIEARLAELASQPPARTAVLRRRLAELAADIGQQMGALDREARRWIQERLPEIYQLAGVDAARSIDSRFVWNASHTAAVQTLATRTYDDLLAATRFVRADTKRFVRQAVAAETRRSIIGGATAQQAGRDLSKQLRQVFGADPIAAVRYRNGARHSLADYADTVLRTTTAEAFNTGTLNTGAATGVQWVEIFDGADCGWVSHDDPDKANGSVRTLDDALGHMLSHPRCARGFGLRPDIGTAKQAEAARRFTPAQQQAAADAERARAAAQPERFSRRRPVDRRQQVLQRRQKRLIRARGATVTAAGAPVSQALELKVGGQLRREVEHALSVIDSVHGDGALPALPVLSSRGETQLGRYFAYVNGPAMDITISSRGSWPAFTTTHEVGHFIDHFGIGTPAGFASTTSELAEWRAAADASNAVQTLRGLRPTAGVQVDMKFRDYLLDPTEVWARSYSQYIAVRSGDPRLLGQLELTRKRGTRLYYPRQWEDDDFEPIAASIDTLFQRLGWRR